MLGIIRDEYVGHVTAYFAYCLGKARQAAPGKLLTCDFPGHTHAMNIYLICISVWSISALFIN